MDNESVYNNESIRNDKKSSKKTFLIVVLLIAIAVFCSFKFIVNFKSFSDDNLKEELSGKERNVSTDSSTPLITYSCVNNCQLVSDNIYNAHWKKNFTIRINVSDIYGFKSTDLKTSNFIIGSNLSIVGIEFKSNYSTNNKLVYDLKLKNNVSVIKKELKSYITIRKGTFVDNNSNVSNDTTIPIYIELYEN